MVRFDQELGPYATLNVLAEEGSSIEIGQRVATSTSEQDFTIIPPNSERVFSVSIKDHALAFVHSSTFPS